MTKLNTCHRPCAFIGHRVCNPLIGCGVGGCGQGQGFWIPATQSARIYTTSLFGLSISSQLIVLEMEPATLHNQGDADSSTGERPNVERVAKTSTDAISATEVNMRTSTSVLACLSHR